MTKRLFTIVLNFVCIILIYNFTYAVPVQWNFTDGGNGHYYEMVTDPLFWSEAKIEAETKGGYLATITSQAETDWIVNTFDLGDYAYWLGGYQDLSDPSYSEPDGGWKWITGELWAYTNWQPGLEPNDNYYDPVTGQYYGEHHLEFNDRPSYGTKGLWNDFTGDRDVRQYFVEWNENPDPVPEPSTVLLFCFGIIGFAGTKKMLLDKHTK